MRGTALVEAKNIVSSLLGPCDTHRKGLVARPLSSTRLRRTRAAIGVAGVWRTRSPHAGERWSSSSRARRGSARSYPAAHARRRAARAPPRLLPRLLPHRQRLLLAVRARVAAAAAWPRRAVAAAAAINLKAVIRCLAIRASRGWALGFMGFGQGVGARRKAARHPARARRKKQQAPITISRSRSRHHPRPFRCGSGRALGIGCRRSKSSRFSSTRARSCRRRLRHARL